jgi:hypothetical protein
MSIIYSATGHKVTHFLPVQNEPKLLKPTEKTLILMLSFKKEYKFYPQSLNTGAEKWVNVIPS